MNDNIIGIVPLGGNATRMNHLPKFLLPCGIGITLLDNIINIYQKNNIFNIISGVSETNNYILQNNKTMKKILVNTKTMAGTVSEIINNIDNQTNPSKNILFMPDTFIKLDDEVGKMIEMLNSYDIVVMVWEIEDYQNGKVGQCKIDNEEIIDVIDKDPSCEYPYFWGSIGWNSKMNKYVDPKWETIGNLIKKSIEINIKVGTIVCRNKYYDCGTYSEFFTMIKNET
jgi:hypothetical protein